VSNLCRICVESVSNLCRVWLLAAVWLPSGPRLAPVVWLPSSSKWSSLAPGWLLCGPCLAPVWLLSGSCLAPASLLPGSSLVSEWLLAGLWVACFDFVKFMVRLCVVCVYFVYIVCLVGDPCVCSYYTFRVEFVSSSLVFYTVLVWRRA
jgi:hypothetical protein